VRLGAGGTDAGAPLAKRVRGNVHGSVSQRFKLGGKKEGGAAGVTGAGEVHFECSHARSRKVREESPAANSGLGRPEARPCDA
jgi:hypothetical protein